MSLRMDRPKSILEDPLWTEDSLVENEDSISSESDEPSSATLPLRNKHSLEVWDENEIWEELHNLSGADEVFDLIQKENAEFSDYKKFAKVGILICAWLGKVQQMNQFMGENNLNEICDSVGRTPLHLSCCSGSLECVKSLIEHGALVSVWDTSHKATPLHCAASKGHLGCMKLLIKNGADVNAGLSQRSPLHYAVQSEASECVKELLEAGAIPNTPQVFTEAPLHVAASLGSKEIIKLLIHYGASVLVQCGTDRSTPLHLTAADGDVECVKILLNAGAKLSATNRKRQTPLHLAALSQSTETVELLLKRGADPNAVDADGRTPLHGAIVKLSRSGESAKLLLNAGANVNKPDEYGYTPLHLAALNEFSHGVMLLLNYGGDLTAKTNGGVSVLTFITRRTPDVIPKFISKLDASIKLSDHEIGDVDCELKLDFRILVPSVAKGETDLLLNFIEVGHREILKHPLCETFLFLKWRRIRKFFLFSLFYHALFVLLFTWYIIGVFLRDCPSFRVLKPCDVQSHINVIGYGVIALNCLLMGKEIFQIAHNWTVYVKEWENWLQWMIIISVFCCVYTYDVDTRDIRSNTASWQHHVAALGIFLTWLELMMIVGRFPIFGLYIQMFTTVSVNFAKFLMAYVCLIVAFGLSFGVLFAKYKSFKTLALALLKTLIMLSGELEFEDVFFDDEALIIYQGTSHIMFLAFALLVTIILANLMVGLAVSDIQGLQRSAGLDRLVRQAELVAHLESILFSRLLGCVPRRFLAFFYRQALLVKSQYHWALYIKPNDPREERIPKDIIRSIYKLVAGRKEKPKRKRRSEYSKTSKTTFKCNGSRGNSVASTVSAENICQAIKMTQVRKYNLCP